jgi:GH24 family phage-related lysozyme (muramidase)
MEVINEGILKALEMLGLGQPQQGGGVLSAVAGMPRPEGKPPVPTNNAMPKSKPPVVDTALKSWENPKRSGFAYDKNKWFSHPSVEGGTPTLGWGHKINKQENNSGKIKIGNKLVDWKQGLTKEEVNSLYEQDISKYTQTAQESLLKAAKTMSGDLVDSVSILPNQLEALTSLIYNIGETNWNKSNAKKELEKGNISKFLEEAFDSDKGFVKSNKKKIKGLVNRRIKERNLFLGQG